MISNILVTNSRYCILGLAWEGEHEGILCFLESSNNVWICRMSTVCTLVNIKGALYWSWVVVVRVLSLNIIVSCIPMNTKWAIESWLCCYNNCMHKMNRCLFRTQHIQVPAEGPCTNTGNPLVFTRCPKLIRVNALAPFPLRHPCDNHGALCPLSVYSTVPTQTEVRSSCFDIKEWLEANSVCRLADFIIKMLRTSTMKHFFSNWQAYIFIMRFYYCWIIYILNYT